MYEGEFKDDRPDGKGVFTYVNGDKYDGQFARGLKNGYGMEYFANGFMYEGQYKNGRAEGEGTMKEIKYEEKVHLDQDVEEPKTKERVLYKGKFNKDKASPINCKFFSIITFFSEISRRI